MTTKYYSVAELTKLWRQVTLLPTDGRDRIEKDFLDFKAGTLVPEMKDWFNRQHHLFSVDRWREIERDILKVTRLSYALAPANLVMVGDAGISLQWYVVEEDKVTGHPEMKAVTLWMTDGSVICLKEGEIAQAEVGVGSSELQIPRLAGEPLKLRCIRLRKESLEEVLEELPVKRALEADPSLRWQLQLTSMGARCVRH